MGRLQSISTVELNRDSGSYRELLLPNKPMQRTALRAAADRQGVAGPPLFPLPRKRGAFHTATHPVLPRKDQKSEEPIPIPGCPIKGPFWDTFSGTAQVCHLPVG